MAGYRVVADLGLCQGHQMCLGEAPGVFAMDAATDQVIVTDPTPGPDRRAEVEAAVTYCPAMALSIQED